MKTKTSLTINSMKWPSGRLSTHPRMSSAVLRGAGADENIEATTMKTLHSLVAGFWPAFSIVRRRIAFLLLVLGAGLLLVAGQSASASNFLRLESPAGEGRSANWRQAAFDPAHTAFNRVETILSPSNVGNLTQAWAAPVGTFTVYASPVVSGGKVFIGGDDGQMYALDAATGAT